MPQNGLLVGALAVQRARGCGGMVGVHTDGISYPYVTLDVSSASHPIYTGQERKAKAEGRVAGFNKRFAGFTAK